MPQDKNRSSSYRSFVTCDNPKGVIECGTIRKSKINSLKREQHQQEHNLKVVVEGDKLENPTTTNSSVGGVIVKEDKKKMCNKQVTRDGFDVSKRGDNKLNHVTNSTWPKGKVSQEVITKDLLKGALDLQESIIMLGKLQEEAFSSFSMSRFRRKEKCKVEEGTFDCMVSGVVNERAMGLEKPWKSTDGMKKVVRESLLRQNMITNPIFDENYDNRMMGCFSDMPSTSSSQSSSMVRSSNFVPSDSSSSSIVSQRRKKRDTNLIFRLMGLESPPSSPRWHIEGENIVTSPRKGQVGAQVSGKKQKSVEEILETLHFKGLLRSSSLNGKTSDVFTPKKERYDERPPIVIMKPMCYKKRDLEGTIMPKYSMEGIMKPTCNSRLSVEGDVTNLRASFSEEGRKSAKNDGLFRSKSSVNRDPEPQMKHETPLRKSSEAENVSPRRKVEENKDSRFRDQGKSPSAPTIINQKDGKTISKQQNSTSFSVFDLMKPETCEISGQRKKSRESTYVIENRKGKVKEKEIEVVSACDTKNVVSVAEGRIFDSFIEQNLARNQIRDYNVDASVEHHQNDIEPVCDINLADTHGYDDTNSCYSEITSVSTSENYSPVCEVTLVTTHENGIPVQNHGNKSPPLPDENEPETSPRTRLQALLLSNSSFLNNLEEHFDIHVFPDLVPDDVGRDGVLIDYANEVMKLKCSEFSQPYLAHTSMHTKETRIPPLDQILEEIGNGIEGLKRYHGSTSDDTFSSDNLYLILDRDLSFKSTAMWDIGWRKMFSRHEIEVVVREVGTVVLGKLIEEVVLDFTVL